MDFQLYSWLLTKNEYLKAFFSVIVLGAFTLASFSQVNAASNVGYKDFSMSGASTPTG